MFTKFAWRLLLRATWPPVSKFALGDHMIIGFAAPDILASSPNRFLKFLASLWLLHDASTFH